MDVGRKIFMAALHDAIGVTKELGPRKTVVVILPDTVERY